MHSGTILRTSLLIVVSGIAGFVAGRGPSSAAGEKGNPPSVLASVPAPGTGALSGKRVAGPESTPAEASTARLSDEQADRLSSLLASIIDAPSFERAKNELAEWFMGHPDDAIAYLSTSTKRDELFRQLFAVWAKKDPHAASLWLSGHPDAPGSDAMASGLAAGVAREDAAAAMKWVAAIKDPAVKLTAGQEAGWEVYRGSEEDAEAGLREAGIPESGIATIRSGRETQFSAMASRNAQNVVSVASAAAAAGATLNAGTVEDLVSVLSGGVSGSGPFAQAKFRVDSSDWTSREVGAVTKRMSVAGGSVRYEPDQATAGE